jgi:hypothetical protein
VFRLARRRSRGRETDLKLDSRRVLGQEIAGRLPVSLSAPLCRTCHRLWWDLGRVAIESANDVEKLNVAVGKDKAVVYWENECVVESAGENKSEGGCEHELPKATRIA